MKRDAIKVDDRVRLVGSRYHTNKVVPVVAVRTDGPWIEAVDVDVGDGRLSAFPPRDIVPVPKEST